MVTYRLQLPIRSKLFKHNKFVESFDINSIIQDETILPCHCENSMFVDLEYCHRLTGDLRFVRNNKLRKLITKGPEYREPSTICWDKAKSSIINGMK